MSVAIRGIAPCERLVSKVLCPSRHQCRTHINSARTARHFGLHVAQHPIRELVKLQATEQLSASTPTGAEYYDVDEICGIRIVMDEDVPTVEYRVKWKDGSADTWESPGNLADNLLRDYDDRWWTAAKKADEETLGQMLAYGRDVLAQVTDENRRSALHFAAGLGNVKTVKLLIAAGADINLQDREGFTPLHMAAGYMQTRAMSKLLSAGADPSLKDNAGRDIPTLVDGLKEKLGLSPGQLPRMLALEEVTNQLLDAIYEEVAPSQILEMREVAGTKQFLVQYDDGRDDEWVEEKALSEEVKKDFEASLEYGEADAILDWEQRGTERKFLLSWKDGHPSTWEPEEHVAPALLQQWLKEHPEVTRRQRKKAPKKKKTGSSQASSSNGSSRKADGNTNTNGVAVAQPVAVEAKQPAGVA